MIIRTKFKINTRLFPIECDMETREWYVVSVSFGGKEQGHAIDKVIIEYGVLKNIFYTYYNEGENEKSKRWIERDVFKTYKRAKRECIKRNSIN